MSCVAAEVVGVDDCSFNVLLERLTGRRGNVDDFILVAFVDGSHVSNSVDYAIFC